MNGFYRIAAASPELKVADVTFNLNEMMRLYRDAAYQGAAVVLFPELSLTGASCGDLFFQERLLKRAEEAALEFAAATAGMNCTAVFGMPVRAADALYNVAVVACEGKICGVIPKSFKENQRHFRSGHCVEKSVSFDGQYTSLMSDETVFRSGKLCFGVDFSNNMNEALSFAAGGAQMIFLLDAAPETAGRAARLKKQIEAATESGFCACALAGASVHESTTDTVCAGNSLIAVQGKCVARSERFCRDSQLVFADIDIAGISVVRTNKPDFGVWQSPVEELPVLLTESPDLRYAKIDAHPFDGGKEYYEDIFRIQCAGLAKRVEHTRAKTLVIGISGGLDSTLALLVCAECCKMLGRPATDIHAYTLPGFGTTGRTYQNAVGMCRELGVTLKEVNIKEACLQHFRDLGHDPAVLDVTYENVQARERTQILMDAANKTGGMVVGTGDLSEIALGWSTYNGDHMSMYSVNCSVPKTLIPNVIKHVAGEGNGELSRILLDVIATPVSPELLPADKDDNIAQKTEDLVGPYELHDFFLYYFVQYGMEPDRIAFLAEKAFEGKYTADVIAKWLEKFLRRFFQQQFKRSCMPDGPQTGIITLSPRGGWQMPSDAVCAEWLK
ncbi:MAG: NAD(+) synthase [Lentisphaeria bacterium]|nr:NAD(+) synthase [Lentisphaeria bacterium]